MTEEFMSADRCIANGHHCAPIALFQRAFPGAMCEDYGQWQTLSHRRFRVLFGMTFIEFKAKLQKGDGNGRG